MWPSNSSHLFLEANIIGIVIKEEDRINLKFLMIMMTTLKSLGKSTYAIWLRFFDEADGSHSDFIVGPFWLIGCHVMCFQKD